MILEKFMKADKKGGKNDLILLLPVIFLTTIFLFCVRAQVVLSHATQYFWYGGEELTGDLYTNFRMEIFVLITVVFGFYMLYCFFAEKVKLHKHKVYIPMLIYVAFVVLSYLFSAEKEIALWGYMNRHEGTVALICYMLIMFYGIHAIKSEENVTLLHKCITVAWTILGIWGIFQVLGFRIDSFPEWVYTPAEMIGSVSLEENQVSDAVMWFFSNQNYSSFFMVFPICFFAMSCIGAEQTGKKVLYATLTGLMLFNLWQSASLGGMVGIAVSVVAAVFIAGFKNIMKWKKSLGLLILAGIISVGASMPVIMREVKSGAGIENSEEENSGETAEEALRFVEIDHVITDGKDIVFSFEGREIRIETENGEVKSITDNTGTEIGPDSDLLTTSTFVHEESGYPIIQVETAACTWNFAMANGAAYFLAPTGTGVELDKVEHMGFEGNEDFATYRGYIWSRTIPLLKDTVLIGKGADTYAVHFPQTDYAGRYNIGYFTSEDNIIIDKPHNMYLGTAVNTGIISMLAMIAIYAIYLIESIKTYRKHEFAGFVDYIGMGIAIAVAGFMVAGLVNDSTVQMMPVVYVLLGVGFAINRMVGKATTEKK